MYTLFFSPKSEYCFSSARPNAQIGSILFTCGGREGRRKEGRGKGGRFLQNQLLAPLRFESNSQTKNDSDPLGVQVVKRLANITHNRPKQNGTESVLLSGPCFACTYGASRLHEIVNIITFQHFWPLFGISLIYNIFGYFPVCLATF